VMKISCSWLAVWHHLFAHHSFSSLTSQIRPSRVSQLFLFILALYSTTPKKVPRKVAGLLFQNSFYLNTLLLKRLVEPFINSWLVSKSTDLPLSHPYYVLCYCSSSQSCSHTLGSPTYTSQYCLF
jgi:hypothetical protein